LITVTDIKDPGGSKGGNSHARVSSTVGPAGGSASATVDEVAQRRAHKVVGLARGPPAAAAALEAKRKRGPAAAVVTSNDPRRPCRQGGARRPTALSTSPTSTTGPTPGPRRTGPEAGRGRGTLAEALACTGPPRLVLASGLCGRHCRPRGRRVDGGRPVPRRSGPELSGGAGGSRRTWRWNYVDRGVRDGGAPRFAPDGCTAAEDHGFHRLPRDGGPGGTALSGYVGGRVHGLGRAVHRSDAARLVRAWGLESGAGPGFTDCTAGSPRRRSPLPGKIAEGHSVTRWGTPRGLGRAGGRRRALRLLGRLFGMGSHPRRGTATPRAARLGPRSGPNPARGHRGPAALMPGRMSRAPAQFRRGHPLRPHHRCSSRRGHAARINWFAARC